MVALVLPFQKFLAAKNYSNAEEFFSQVLPWAIGAAAVIVPLAGFFLFRRLTSGTVEAPEIKDIPPPPSLPNGSRRAKRLAK